MGSAERITCDREGLMAAAPGESDLRTARRHATTGQVGLMHVGEIEDFCRVRNISATGLMAHVYRPLAIGEEVRIETKSGLLLQGYVVWAGDHVPELASRAVHQVGVRFCEEIDVEAVLSTQFVNEVGDLQRWPRIKIDSHLRLILGNGRQFSGTLCDISQGGAKVLTAYALMGEISCTLILRGLPPLNGSVRWTGGTKIGLEFDQAIKLETLILWIQDRRAEMRAA